MQILQLDVQGMPQEWITPEDAACYYATDSVAWTSVKCARPCMVEPTPSPGCNQRLMCTRFWPPAVHRA